MPESAWLEQAYLAQASGLTGPEVVESDEFAHAWWIAGIIKSTSGSAERGLWVTNEIDEANPGTIIAVNAEAKHHSDWGADLREPVGGDGRIGAINCL